MSLPRYPEYKESGIPWVGEVPANWQVLPLIGVANERSEANLGMQEDNLLSLSYGRIVRKDIESNDGLLPASFETYQVVRAGDIVLRLTDLQNDKRSLRSALVGEQGIITSAYLALQPNGVDSRYLAYLLRGYDLSKVFYSMGGGLRQSMKFSDMKRMPVLLPPKGEQTAIADFLDRETAKIDALIAEQEDLTALLDEKRQATISHAVTRGLNPRAPMKDSGVAWLGELPMHWRVRRLKTICPEITVGIVVEPSRYYVDAGVPALRSLNVNAGQVTMENLVYISEESNELLAKSRLRAGDLVSVRSGQTGVTAVVPRELDGCNCIDLIIIRKPPHDCEQFLCWFFASDSALRQFASGSGGAIQQHFNIGMAMNLQVPLPPVDEQRSIVAFLNCEAEKLDALRAEMERAVVLLNERRSALIAAAVTGQIDVRGAVPQPVLQEAVVA